MASVEKGVKFDGEKPQWGLLPFKQVEQVVDVLTFGAKKYSPDNWKKVPDAERRYFDAMMRHIAQYKYDSKLDDETGKSHLAHAVCCALFLMGFDDGEGIKLDENDMPLKTEEVGTRFDLKPTDIFPPKVGEVNPMDLINKLNQQHHFVGNNAIIKKSPHKCTLSTDGEMSPIDGVLNNIENQLDVGGSEIDDSVYIDTIDEMNVYCYTGNLSKPFKYSIDNRDDTVKLYE